LQIKKAAQRGSKEEVKALAKQIVGVRQQREKSFKATAKVLLILIILRRQSIYFL
jgi:hypothetical protein